MEWSCRNGEECRGFSLIDLIITVAIVGTTAWISVVSVVNIRQGALERKMASDIAVLNSAATEFKRLGGKFSSSETAESVLSALKWARSNPELPDFTGFLVSHRLIWKKQTTEEAASDNPRVRWNNSSERFVISFQGKPGLSDFTLDKSSSDDVPAKVRADDNKATSPIFFSEKPGWRWDYNEPPAKATTSTSIEPTTVAIAGSGVPVKPVKVSLEVDTRPIDAKNALKAPVIAFPNGAGQPPNYSITIALKNPNPRGSSKITYSIDYGLWKEYNGAPITIGLGETFITKTNSANSARWSNSRITTRKYGDLLAEISSNPTAELISK